MLPSGESQKHEFQAETRQLLDIVARTLYSEKEVLVLTMMNKATHQYIYNFQKLRSNKCLGKDKNACNL